MRTLVISTGVLFILIIIALAFTMMGSTTMDESCEAKYSTYDWVRRLDVSYNAARHGHYIKNVTYTFVDSEIEDNIKIEHWKANVYFGNFVEHWVIIIKFKAEYDREYVPKSGIYVLRGDATNVDKEANYA